MNVHPKKIGGPKKSIIYFLLSFIAALLLTLIVKEPSFTATQVYVLFLLFFAMGLWFSEAVQRDGSRAAASSAAEAGVAASSAAAAIAPAAAPSTPIPMPIPAAAKSHPLARRRGRNASTKRFCARSTS